LSIQAQLALDRRTPGKRSAWLSRHLRHPSGNPG
jgi:hypothetical protein